MTGIFFSGTGNTKHCLAKFLAGVNKNAQMYSIEDTEALSAIKKDDEIVFAHPIYYSNMPKIVRDFINSNGSVWAGKKIYVITTMGLFSGDGSRYTGHLLKKHGAKISGGLHVHMPDCVGDVKALKKPLDKNKQLVIDADKLVARAAKRYKNGKPTHKGMNPFSHLLGFIGQRLYFRGKVKDYTDALKIDTAKCIGCGKCAELCPMKTIHIENGKAVAGDKCTKCYRCISNCPKQAITLIGKSVIEQSKIERYL